MFYIEGNAVDIFHDFGKTSLIEAKASSTDTIRQDIPRSPFLGNAAEWAILSQNWNKLATKTPDYYIQGDITSANLQCLFGNMPLIKHKESIENYKQQFDTFYFAFVNEKQELCGISFYYRKDDSAQWIVGLVKHTASAPAERKVFLFSSINPKPYLAPGQHFTQTLRINNSKGLARLEALSESPLVRLILKQFILPNGKSNPSAKVVSLCFQSHEPDEEYSDNQALLARLASNPRTFIESPILQQLNNRSQYPDSKQILTCLDEQSYLYQTLKTLYARPPQESFDDDVLDIHTRVIVTLDQMGLLPAYASFTDSPEFIAFLNGFFISDYLAFFKVSLQDETKVQVLRFMSHSSYASDFIQKIMAPSFNWNVFFKLTTLDWTFPEDDSLQAMVCQILCQNPAIETISLDSLIQVLKSAPNLLRFFHPIDLANFLSQSPPEQIVEQIKELKASFDNLLVRFEQLASLRKKKCSSDVLKSLGTLYLEQPGRAIEDVFGLCDNKEQIAVCALLLHRNFHEALIAGFLVNPALVWSIYKLNSLDLIDMILTDLKENSKTREALVRIYHLHKESDKNGALLLLAHERLTPDKFPELIEIFKQNPMLSSRMIELYRQGGFSGADFEAMAFDAVLRQKVCELNQEIIPPLIDCHDAALLETCLASPATSDKLSEDSHEKPGPQDAERVPEDIALFILEITRFIKNLSDTALPQGIAETLPLLITRTVFTEGGKINPSYDADDFLSPILKENSDDNQLQLCQHLKVLVSNYLYVINRFRQQGIKPLTNVLVSSSLTMLLFEVMKELQDFHFQPDIADQLEKQLLLNFALLSPSSEKDLYQIKNASKALSAIWSEYQGEPPQSYFEKLLEQPAFASAILELRQRKLRIIPLLELEAEQREELIPLINFLNTASFKNQADYLQLALDYVSDAGQTFRKIIPWIIRDIEDNDYAKSTDFVVNLIRAMRDGKTDDYQAYMQPFKMPKAPRYGIETGLRVTLIYRLKNLEMDDETVYFLLGSSANSKKYCELITKMEDQFDRIRERLELKYPKTVEYSKSAITPTKFELYQEQESQCRARLYKLAYDQLTATAETALSKEAIMEKVLAIQAPLLEVADMDTRPWLRKTMMIIANILSVTLTLGLTNAYHYQKTGDLLFFARPHSSSDLQKQDREFAEMIAAPAA